MGDFLPFLVTAGALAAVTGCWPFASAAGVLPGQPSLRRRPALGRWTVRPRRRR
jgi:hypothetical protein